MRDKKRCVVFDSDLGSEWPPTNIGTVTAGRLA
jgi:hypothetical protein